MMFRLSIFSSSTLRSKELLTLIKSPALGLTAACMIALEIASRVLIPGDPIPRGGYHSAEIREQTLQYQELEQLDLLIIGSSIAAVNFPPQSIDATLRRNGKADFTTFNAGIRGCNYSCIAVGVSNNYLSRNIPRQALLVVGPPDINHTNTFVVSRSQDFINSFEQPAHRRWFRNSLSSISSLYGFDEQIRSYLTRGRFNFDTAKVTVRGQVDMGDKDRARPPEYPEFDIQSPAFRALDELIDLLKSKDVHVVLLPILGDSQARSKLLDNAKTEFYALLVQLADLKSIELLRIPEAHMPDEGYIDDIHLNFESALKHGTYIADALLQQGVLEETP